MTPGSMTTLLADELVRTSTAEAVQFWVLGVVAVVGALGVVFATKAVYSAIFLATTMIVLAVFYVAQGALLLGGRAGGRLHRRGDDAVPVRAHAHRRRFIGLTQRDPARQRVAASLVGLGFGVLLIAGIGNATIAVTTGATAPGALDTDSNYGIERSPN